MAGLDTVAVLAAIVLVTGLACLAVGPILVRAVPGWWRLLALQVALALLWFGPVPLTVAANITNRPRGRPHCQRALPDRHQRQL